MSRPKRITRTDVAAYAQVSKATVSYVLNQQAQERRIPAVTVDRVLDAIHALDYSPSHHAQALRSGRTQSICVLLPERKQADRSIDRRLAAVVTRARERGWYAGPAPIPSTDPAHVSDLVASARFQGFLCLEGPGMDALRSALPEACTTWCGSPSGVDLPAADWDCTTDARTLARRCRERHLPMLILQGAAPAPIQERAGRSLATMAAVHGVQARRLQTDPDTLATRLASEPGLAVAVDDLLAPALLSVALMDRRPACGFALQAAEHLLLQLGGMAVPDRAVASAAVDLLIERCQTGDDGSGLPTTMVAGEWMPGHLPGGGP